MFNLEDYNYDLPKELIAQAAHHPADECKFLITNIRNGELEIQDKIFKDIKDNIGPNTTIFFNNSKVLKARIPLTNAKTITPDGKEKNIENGEIFFLKQIDEFTFEALVRPGKKITVGSHIYYGKAGLEFQILGNTDIGRTIKSSRPALEVLEQFGQLPLPPYIEYSEEKEKNYQTVFAEKQGSVAAPTASLHFTNSLLQDLTKKGVSMEYLTLHVGLGTFKTVDVEDITKYNIHEEIIEIDLSVFEKIATLKSNKHSILAVGTTVVRTLETLPYFWVYAKENNLEVEVDSSTKTFWDTISKNIHTQKVKDIITYLGSDGNTIKLSTKIFIFPGFEFKIVDKMITNFHLPKSSLLMLVAAFVGYENMKIIYDHAIKKQYKFFSFGDAMMIEKLADN